MQKTTPHLKLVENAPDPLEDKITILEVRPGETQGKSFFIDGDKITLTGTFSNSRLYKTTQASFTKIEGLFDILKTVAQNDRLAVIRGEPLFDLQNTDIARQKRLHERPARDKMGNLIADGDGGHVTEPATYKDAPRRWIIIDADHIDPAIWRGLDPAKDAQKIARRYRATLPEWIRKTKMVVQLSSSHGLGFWDATKGGDPVWSDPKPKLHLFCLTDRHFDKDQGNAIAINIGCDPAPMRTVQHVYVANPQFEDSSGVAPDPVGHDRLFILEGEPFATLPPDSDPIWKAQTARLGMGGARHPTGKAAETGYNVEEVRKGWRGYLDIAGSDNEAAGHFRPYVMKALASFFWRHGPDADLSPFWAELEPVLKLAAEVRGEAYAQHAREIDYPQIAETISEFERQSRAGRVGDALKVIDDPAPPPALNWPLTPRRHAREGWVDADWTPDRHLDMRGVGAGKTEEMIATALALIEQIDTVAPRASGIDLLSPGSQRRRIGERVYFIVQSMDLATELEERARAQIGTARVFLWRGMEQPDPKSPMFPMCRRIHDVEAALRSGGSVQDVCGVAETGLCPYHRNNPNRKGPMCGAHGQKLAATGKQHMPLVVILAGAFFTSNSPPSEIRAAISTEGEVFTTSDGTGLRVHLPEASLVVLDEWRPAEAQITNDAELFCAVDDLRIVISDTAPAAEGWQAAVDVSAIETYRRAIGDDPISDRDMAAVAAVGGALARVRDGLGEWEPVDAETLLTALRGPARVINVKGKGEIDFSLLTDGRGAVAQALDAVRKMVVRPRDISRRHGAQITEEMWHVSRAAAFGGAKDAPPDLKPDELVKIIRHNARLLRVAELLEALAQSWGDIDKTGRNTGELLGVRAKTKEIGDMTVVGYKPARRVPLTRKTITDVPVVVLDAVAEPDIVEQWLPDLTVTKDEGVYRVPDAVRIRQIVDSQVGYGQVSKKGPKFDRWVRRMRAYIEACAIQHDGQGVGEFDVGVIMPKALAAALAPLPPNVVVVTWGKEAGVNVAQGVARGIVISRKLISSFAAKFISEIVFGLPADDGDYLQVRIDRMIRTSEGAVRMYRGGEASALSMMRHPDPNAEMIRRAVTDGSFDQGLGRFRVHRRTGSSPLLLDIITSHPSRDLPVDDLWTLNSLKGEADDDDFRTAAAGVEVRGTRGAVTLAGLVSGRVGAIYQELLEGKKRIADEQARELAVKRARKQMKDNRQRKREATNSSAPEGYLGAGMYGIRKNGEISKGRFPYNYSIIIGESALRADSWLPSVAEVGFLDLRPARAAVLQVTAKSRPIRFWLRLDPKDGDLEKQQAAALKRLKIKISMPLHRLEFE
ncbi:hypothetical protein [Primorskyibacter sp. S87]|uniref:hypothetical protein n=1 Tax=Primorskyibacter sp. S87 TaxID=3415126 RepID=UPI003C7B40D6